MIIGYMLFDMGGTLLLDEQFVSLISTERESLFASLLTAISRAMEQILRQRPRHLELENMHLYLGFGYKFIFVLISDIENDELLKLADLIISELEKGGFTADDINTMATYKELARQIIRRYIVKKPMYIDELIKIANIIKSTSDFIPQKKIGIEIKIPQPIELKKKKFKAGKREDIDRIFQLIYQDKLNKVIDEAPKYFDGPHGDIAKMLYVKAALLLREMGRGKDPDLDLLYSIADTIQDYIAREALINEIRAYSEMKPSSFYTVFIKHTDEIQSIMELDELKGKAYKIIFIPAPWKPILEKIKDSLPETASTLRSLAELYLRLIQVIFATPHKMDEWLEVFSAVKNKFDSLIKRTEEQAYYYYIMLASVIVWGLLTPGISTSDGERIVGYYLDYLDKFRSKYGFIRSKVPITIRSKAYFLLYSVLIRTLLEVWRKDGKLSKRVFEVSKEAVRFIGQLLGNGLIPYYVYYVVLVSILANIVAITTKSRYVPREIIDLLLDLTPSSMFELSKFDEVFYAEFYIAALDLLGGIASVMETDTIRVNLLVRIAKLFEKIVEYTKDAPIFQFIARLLAIKYYCLAGTKDALIYAKTLIERTKKFYSPFAVSILVETYKGSVEFLKRRSNE